MILISFTLSIILGLFQLQLLASIGVLDTWQPLTTSAQPLREVAMELGPLQAQSNAIWMRKLLETSNYPDPDSLDSNFCPPMASLTPGDPSRPLPNL